MWPKITILHRPHYFLLVNSFSKHSYRIFRNWDKKQLLNLSLTPYRLLRALKKFDWLIDCMEFLHCFQNYYSHITLTAHMFVYSLGLTCTRVGLWTSEVYCPGALQQKTQRIQCNSYLGTTGYKSYTLPLSHAGLLEKDVGWLYCGFNATLTAKVISWWSVTHMCFLALSHQY